VVLSVDIWYFALINKMTKAHLIIKKETSFYFSVWNTF